MCSQKEYVTTRKTNTYSNIPTWAWLKIKKKKAKPKLCLCKEEEEEDKGRSREKRKRKRKRPRSYELIVLLLQQTFSRSNGGKEERTKARVAGIKLNYNQSQKEKIHFKCTKIKKESWWLRTLIIEKHLRF